MSHSHTLGNSLLFLVSVYHWWHHRDSVPAIMVLRSNLLLEKPYRKIPQLPHWTRARHVKGVFPERANGARNVCVKHVCINDLPADRRGFHWLFSVLGEVGWASPAASWLFSPGYTRDTLFKLPALLQYAVSANYFRLCCSLVAGERTCIDCQRGT